MTNNIIADLRKREARDRAAAQGEYWLTVERVASNANVKAGAVEKALAEAGKTVEDFERDLALVSDVERARVNAEEHDMEALIDAEHRAERAYKDMIVEHDKLRNVTLPQREQAAQQAVRVAESKRKRARKDLAAYHAELSKLRQAKGEEQAQPTEEPEEPRLTYTKRMLPGSSVPRDPAVWDHLVRDDGSTYWRNRRTGAIE